MNTSANVDFDFYKEMKKISVMFDISIPCIFKDITMLAVSSAGCGRVNGCLMEYQNHHPSKWIVLHYNLDEFEAERFSSARHIYKMSVSKLAFAGFVFFWKLLILKYSGKLYKIKEIKIFRSYDKYCNKFKNTVEYLGNRLNFNIKT